MCRIHFSTFKFLVIALLRRGCVGCHCCSKELENVTTDFDKWKKIHFYHTILSFHCGFAKKPKLFCLSWVYGVYSISKLFLFVQTFIQEKITFLRCTTAKQKWKKSIWIFLVEFSQLSRKWEKGVANWIRKPKLLVCVNCQNNVEVAIKSQGNDS